MTEPMTSFVSWHCRTCTSVHNAPTVRGVPDWSLPTGWTHGTDRFTRATCAACSHYSVGDVQGLLTITALNPLVVKCACGRSRTDRTISHLRKGLKSCGCGAKPRRVLKTGAQINGLRIISQHKYGQAIRERTWNVECLRCLAVDAIGEEWLIARAKRNAQGCRACNGTASRGGNE